jgi:hypothetical protein
MKANVMGCPRFNDKFVTYPQFEKEWWAYRITHHDLVGGNLVAKNLRENCVNNEVRKMIRNKQNLDKMWG